MSILTGKANSLRAEIAVSADGVFRGLRRLSFLFRKIRSCQKIADPTFNEPGKIDMIIGVELFYQIIKDGRKVISVFDGSAPTTSGRNLNDILLSGRVQEDVFNMLRFRKHKIVLTVDIKQMFRQILIDPTQRNLLKIFWKNKHWEKPIEYEINTVTYGTKSAPFLATRVIKQLCLDGSDAFPLAAEITLSDIYMDDIVTGCENN
ncbi:integrase catalytic domain-containing protein [Trichonephila clavipes]|nr:integrase catalytic domain-containing protein [Trichonephila clavipes]